MAKKSKPRNRAEAKARRLSEAALRKRQVAELYLQGLSQVEIGRRLEIRSLQVGRTLAKLREDWLALALVDFDTKKAEQLMKIDKVEATAWEGWFRSCEDEVRRRRVAEEDSRLVPDEDAPAEPEGVGQKGQKRSKKPKMVRKMVPSKVVEETTTRAQAGDPKFLERISWCIDTRLKILGAYKNTTPPGTLVIRWEELYSRPAEGQVPDPIEQAIREAALRGPGPSTGGPPGAGPGPGPQATGTAPTPEQVHHSRLLECKTALAEEGGTP